MADIEHKNLTGADLHQCKGAETAPAGWINTSQGDGTAEYEDIVGSLRAANYITLVTRFADISTAASIWVASPLAGTVEKILVTLHGTISVADATVTAELNGVAMSGLSITITQVGSVAGSVFSGSPSGNNSVSEGQAIEIITDGGSSTAVIADVTILINTEI